MRWSTCTVRDPRSRERAALLADGCADRRRQPRARCRARPPSVVARRPPASSSRRRLRCPRCDGAPARPAAYAAAARLLPRRRLRSRRSVASLRACASTTTRRTRASSTDVRELMRTGHARSRPHTCSSRPGCVVVHGQLEALAVSVPAARAGPEARAARSCSSRGSETIVDEHPGAFLRGLFHSDGCRVNNWATRTVAGRAEALRVPAVAVRQPLRRDIRGFCCRRARPASGIPWRQSNWKTISVVPPRRRRRVLDRGLIGPKR